MKTKALLLIAAVSLAGTAAWLRPSAPAHVKTGRLTPRAAVSPNAVRETLPPASSHGDFDRERILAEIATTKDEVAMQLTGDLYAAQSALEKGRAADALAAHGTFDAVANLVRLAGLQNNAEDRAVILDGLANLSGEEAFHTLASVLAATRNPQLVEAAAVHLARAASPEILTTLVALYRERNDAPFQKNQVLHTIAALRNPSCSRQLAKLAGTAPEPALAAAAATARLAITPSAIEE